MVLRDLVYRSKMDSTSRASEEEAKGHEVFATASNGIYEPWNRHASVSECKRVGACRFSKLPPVQL